MNPARPIVETFEPRELAAKLGRGRETILLLDYDL